MTNEQSAFLAAQNRHHRYMGFGKKQRYIEVFQCSGEDMNSVLTGPQPSTLAMAAQAIAGGANPNAAAVAAVNAAAVNSGGGILPGSNPSAIAAAAAKSSNPPAGLLPSGMLNSLQNQSSAILTNGLVGNQMPTFPNSHPLPQPPSQTAPASSSLEQLNALQSNSLFLNPQNLALLGQNPVGSTPQLGINSYNLPPPPQSPASVATPSNPLLPAAPSTGGVPGILPSVRPSMNNLPMGVPGDAATAALWNAAVAGGIPVSGAQALFPFGMGGLPTNALQANTQSLLNLPASSQFQPASAIQLQHAGLNGLSGFLLSPPQSTQNTPLLRLPPTTNPNIATNAAALALSNQQNQASLLQSQLAAQRLLMSQSLPGVNSNSSGIGHFNANPGLLPTVSLDQIATSIGTPPIYSSSALTTSVSSNTGKRSFEEAFNSTSPGGVAAAVAHAANAAHQAAKRASYSYDRSTSQPTISAGPTTYSHPQQTTTNDP